VPLACVPLASVPLASGPLACVPSSCARLVSVPWAFEKSLDFRLVHSPPVHSLPDMAPCGASSFASMIPDVDWQVSGTYVEVSRDGWLSPPLALSFHHRLDTRPALHL
jgi:hypothetical protein